MIGWLKSILGITDLEKKVEGLERVSRDKSSVRGPELRPIEEDVLNRIDGKSLSAGDIALNMDKSRSYISQILNGLKEKDLLESHKSGRRVFYTRRI